LETATETLKNEGLGAWFSTCQVGAFCVFRPGYTETPFIFWRFWPKIRKIRRFRGWCNTTSVCLAFYRLGPGIVVLPTSGGVWIHGLGPRSKLQQAENYKINFKFHAVCCLCCWWL